MGSLFFVIGIAVGGSLSAALAYIINRLLVDRWSSLLGEERIIIYILPGVEEIVKNGAALLLGGGMLSAYIISIHMIFGLIEGIYDLIIGEGTGIPALFLSILSHSLFGFVALFFAVKGASPHLIIFGGILPHIIWNLAIGRIFSK